MSAQGKSKANLPVPYMQNRELSWLDFNKRVLDQGADETVPLLERFNFISIFWSNLQEFFMVRVGSLTDLLLVKKPIVDSKSNMTPAEQIDAIHERCHELYPYYERTYKKLRKLLAAEGVERLEEKDLDEKERTFLDKYMRNEVMPLLSPQIINARHPFPHLENGRLYVVVRLNDKKNKSKKSSGRQSRAGNQSDGRGDASRGSDGTTSDVLDAGKSSKNVGAEGVTLGIIPLPNQCERIVKLPGKHAKFMLLEHVIEMYASEIYSMYKVKHTNIICVTRNADLDATEGSDEQGDDYREHMKRILKKRTRLAPVRLECQRPLSSTVEAALLERLNLREDQTYVTSVPLDLSYTYQLPSFLSQKKRRSLTQAPFTPAWPASLDRNRPMLEQVAEHEVLLSYPYESMDPFVQLLREAASDPDVVSIEITLYRLASQSHLAEALIAAAESGKEVTVLLELRARFDESNNIAWSQRFEEAGCHVIYGFHDLKVHSKICSITRQTEDGLQMITQLGTGNYNEKTARLYTDFSFITTDSSMGSDADRFFRNMALENTSDSYEVLWVAPLQIKQNILASIDEQIQRAQAGEPTGLFFKTNSITDNDIINKIVQASQAGVSCTLFVRGISCIVPGIAGYTDNVRVVSIVGRLLEHSRIYCFGPRDNCRVYLSSADLMTRNMDKRIEIAWPVVDEELRDEILGYLTTCMADTAKLRELLPDKSYTPLGYFAQAGRAEERVAGGGIVGDGASDGDENGGETMLFDAQNVLINEAQRQQLIAMEITAARRYARMQDTRADDKTTTDAGDADGAAEEAEETTPREEERQVAEQPAGADAAAGADEVSGADADTSPSAAADAAAQAGETQSEAIHVDAVILDAEAAARAAVEDVAGDATEAARPQQDTRGASASETTQTSTDTQIVHVPRQRSRRSAGIHAAGIALGTGMLAVKAVGFAGKAAARAIRNSAERRRENNARGRSSDRSSRSQSYGRRSRRR